MEDIGCYDTYIRASVVSTRYDYL